MVYTKYMSNMYKKKALVLNIILPLGVNYNKSRVDYVPVFGNLENNKVLSLNRELEVLALSLSLL